jgi:hypothetical protein
MARIPAFSFQDMVDLAYANNMAMWQVFPDELVLAICWEETQFNNIPQDKGSAVGLGQVEPSELPKLHQYGVFQDRKSILNDPANAIEAVSYMLMHGYVSQKATSKSRREALKRYAGYYSDHAAWRLNTIAGWEACERALLAIPEPKFGYPDQVLSALAFARSFKSVAPAVRAALFPGA